MQLVLLFLAIGLISISAGQFFQAGIHAWRIERRLKTRRQRRQSSLRNATRIARLASELDVSAQPSSAGNWRVMEVVKVVDEAEDTKSYYLADPYQQALPDFHPGQYLMVRPALAGAYQATRCYSLSVPPNKALWRITVKKQLGSDLPRPDRKTGVLSAWLHDNIRDGDCLLIGGPSGQFFLPKEYDGPLVLLAAGVGITPMSSMLQFSVLTKPTRPVSLHYQVKDMRHWPLGREVHDCVHRSPACRVVSYLSRAEPNSIDGLDNIPGQLRCGQINVKEVVEEARGGNAHFYLCGPDAWMEQVRFQLFEAGVAEQQIHWESFGSGTIAPSESSQSKEGSNLFTVHFHRSGTAARWESLDQSLWEFAQSNDVTIPSGCLSGVCGSCRVKVLKGSVQYDRKIGLSLPDDECLSCVSQPAENLVLDL